MDHQATERQSVDAAMERLEEVRSHIGLILERLSRICPLARKPVLADIGAAQGLVLIACRQRNDMEAVGVEPYDQARRVAEQLASQLGLDIDIRNGSAENLPLEDERFDVVHSLSVVEHVGDPQRAFDEAYRILAPGGVFWFHTASSLCPRQFEIARFPLFGWYPDKLKRKIMNWAMTNKPNLIGHTQAPAMHWFTPTKAKRMLTQSGFEKVYDRWDLRMASEGGRVHAILLNIIRRCKIARFAANILTPSCTFAAIK